MKFEIETVHIDKMCRTCLSEENNMKSLFSIDESFGETMRLFEKLTSCTSVQVMENDGLPSHVCLQCVHSITRAFSFALLCKRSENALRGLLGQPTQTTFLGLKPAKPAEFGVDKIIEIISAITKTLPSDTESLNNVSEVVTFLDNDILTDNILPEVSNETDAQELDIKPENNGDSRFMEPNEKSHQSFRDKELHFTTDSDLESEKENSSNQNQSKSNLSKTSTPVRCSVGDTNSVSSISTSILDEAEEVKVLKEKLSEKDSKCKQLECEINKAKIEITAEKIRTEKLEKKLQFVKDNQEVFMRLKEAYINMKYNEAAGRKMIEIREKGIQTWEGILCKGCIDAEEMRREVEHVRAAYNDSFIIPPAEMDHLVNTIKYLKDLIERREK